MKTIDESAAVLQRVDEIEAFMNRHRDQPLGPTSQDFAQGHIDYLCAELRTALADTRRVDWMDKNQFDIELGPDIRTSIDAAMAATPRANR